MWAAQEASGLQVTSDTGIWLLPILLAQEALCAWPLEDGAVLEGSGLGLQYHLDQAEDGDDLWQSRAQLGDTSVSWGAGPGVGGGGVGGARACGWDLALPLSS